MYSTSKDSKNITEKNYKGQKHYWIGELEDRLTGQALVGLKTIGQIDDTYDAIKDKLLQWYEEEKEVRMTKARERFHGVTMGTDETILLYSNRLLSLFKMAYPNKTADTNTTLLTKFQQTVPKPFRDIINNQIVDIRVKNETVRFSHLQKCARIFEITAGKDKDENRNEEIIINLTQGNNKRPERDIYDRPWHQRSGNREKPWYNCRGQGEQRPSNQYPT